ncbi:MAG: hypothetical protein ACE5KJ_03855, partial [Candidatus Zixiibacteriota bacterium]
QITVSESPALILIAHLGRSRRIEHRSLKDCRAFFKDVLKKSYSYECISIVILRESMGINSAT